MNFVRPLVHEAVSAHSPESLVEQLRGEAGVVLLRSAMFDSPHARYSFVTARPFLKLRSFGSRCEIFSDASRQVLFGNPWHVLDGLVARFELLDELDLPFPLGGCFGFWGYDLKNFVEPKLPRRAVNDLELPDCHVGFYDSLVVFDHRLARVWSVSTGLNEDGSRSERRAEEQAKFWSEKLRSEERAATKQEADRSASAAPLTPALSPEERENARVALESPNNVELDQSLEKILPLPTGEGRGEGDRRFQPAKVFSNFTRDEFIAKVARAQEYIRAGDIYQVNLAHRLTAASDFSGWEFFQRLAAISPAPFAAYLDCGDFQIASSSPELFLRLSGAHIETRPIKGTRPRDPDPTRDAQLTYELQTSPKEMAELVMITDLLRNDLGKVCEYGSVQVPELVRLERFSQVQHLVSTVEGRLRSGVTHFAALASCFPGGSITGAPKIRAMEIIDELESVTRGPYTGCLGYLGFNRESQLNIAIRTAVCQPEAIHFHVGAGIVADSMPAAEYEETLAKARGFLAALELANPVERRSISSAAARSSSQ